GVVVGLRDQALGQELLVAAQGHFLQVIVGLGVGQVALGRLDGGLVGGGQQRGQQVALLHLGVEVRVPGGDVARDLAADDDIDQRLDDARGGDILDDLPAVDRG